VAQRGVPAILADAAGAIRAATQPTSRAGHRRLRAEPRRDWARRAHRPHRTKERIG